MLVTLGYAETVQSYESRQALMAKASQSEGAALETWTSEQNEVNETEEMNLGGGEKRRQIR